MRRLFFAAMAVLVCAFGASSCAVAQSFDCKRATTTIEKVICGNEWYDLRDIDAALGKAFSRRIHGTSAEESRRLVLEQRAWLARRLEVCRFGSLSRWQELLRDYVECLDELYQERIAALNHKPIDLVYSGNDRVCPRLHTAMNSYHERNPAQWSFLRALPTILELSGFEAVRWLDPEDADVFLNKRFAHAGMIFEGDVFGDGTTRFVNMRYLTTGTEQANYQTLVFLFQPFVTRQEAEGVTAKLALSRDSAPPPEIASVLVSFEPTRSVDPEPYLQIWKESPRIRFVSEIGASSAAKAILEERSCPLCEGPQNAIVINGRVYFHAGWEAFHESQETTALYALTSDLSLEIICLTKGNTERYVPR